ncbi:phage portal protein [Rhodovulum visakhapatnamense]|uniref:Phage portal protein n=3 Tax=Rhodovulum visakhapatnamense TaxID=364297 RepID=A0ABS1RLS3_9RHOB|nr:phage portal protein [Rhodovulum visakhapatnamense]
MIGLPFLTRGRKAEAQIATAPAPRREPPVTAAMAAVEPSGTRDPAPWFGDLWAGGQSRVRSLPVVTPLAAQRHATVFACCNVIAGDLAKVPLRLYQRMGPSRAEPVVEHAATYLLNTESAPGVAARVARFALVYAFALRGRAYAFAPRDGAGELTLLDVIRPDLCAELRDGRARFYAFEDGAGVQRRAPSRAMVHLRYMAEDGWTGRSPLQVAAESVGLALAGQEAAARAASGVQMRAVLKMEDVYEDDEAWHRNARRVRNALIDPEANGIPIIGATDDIKSLDLSAADQQLLESRKFDREQIAAIYRVPPSKLQMLEHGVKANGQQQAIDYKTDCLLHWGGFVEAQLALGVLTEAERRAGLFFRHDYDALMQATTKERYDALKAAVGGPFLTANEARAEDGRAPVDGGERLNPAANMTRKEDSKTERTEDEV